MDQYIAMVDKQRERILDAFDYIWKNPETGYREWKTHRYLKAQFEELGYEVVEAGNIPGFYADVDTGKEGPMLVIFGEMDGLLIPAHPESDPETGAVHACGHVAQVAALVGVAAALKEEGALDGLCGKIRLVAVPAEEGVELEFRQQLIQEGVIHHVSGKEEFLYRGMLEGADLAFMVHTDTGPFHRGYFNGGSNGKISKTVEFQGVSAHAGGLPHKGVNALYAANLALSAINALRETFEDDNHIRVHPIITNGGASVNAIPDKVELVTYVRGATMDALMDASRKVDRAVAASAAAMGAKVRITNTAATLPRRNDRTMMAVFAEAMEEVMEIVDVEPEKWGTGCSDMGDIMSVMPAIHPYVSGAVGTEHGSNYYIGCPESACVDSAKVQFVALRKFLSDGAAHAKKAIANYKPNFASVQEQIAYMDGIDRVFDAVEYDEKGNVSLNLYE